MYFSLFVKYADVGIFSEKLDFFLNSGVQFFKQSLYLKKCVKKQRFANFSQFLSQQETKTTTYPEIYWRFTDSLIDSYLILDHWWRSSHPLQKHRPRVHHWQLSSRYIQFKRCSSLLCLFGRIIKWWSGTGFCDVRKIRVGDGAGGNHRNTNENN